MSLVQWTTGSAMSSLLQTGRIPSPQIPCVAHTTRYSASKLTKILLGGQVLNVNPTAMPGIVTITGVTGLYVSVNVSLLLLFCIFLGNLFLPRQKSGLGKCREHQAHLVQPGIHLANQRHCARVRLVSHLPWIKYRIDLGWLMACAALSIIPGNGLDLYWFDSFAIGAYVSGLSYLKVSIRWLHDFCLLPRSLSNLEET